MKEHENKDKEKDKMKKRPNILILMVDQERYPSVYESEDVKKWRRENLKAQEWLKKNGFELKNHYAGSTACSPSRATLYTGQYPSLHGVTQTSGAAKGPFDPDMFWLDPNTVPTMGDYFREAGYETYWKGKWHASDEDILIPGTKNAYTSYTATGVPDKEKVDVYLNANRLDSYGFSGWVGPEPHGSAPRNSGSSASIGLSGRDEIYAAETIELIQTLEKKDKTKDSSPWFIMCSFVNPHDIALFGAFSEISPLYNFTVDPSVPSIPPAPTAHESLETKPSAQKSYKHVYQEALQPLVDTEHYRRLYYSLQKEVDEQMQKVIKALKHSSFYDDTIIVFLSDHGELLGAHGGLFQKWYNTYEESIHVPCIFHSKKLFSSYESTDMLTSHVDILPTLLGLANIDANGIQEKLKANHNEVHPLVGRDLSPLLRGKNQFFRANEPLYFMSDDDFTRGLNQYTVSGKPYESVIQPNHTEAILTKLPTGKNDTLQTWKFTRYFDNPQFWSNPGCEDKVVDEACVKDLSDDKSCSLCITNIKTSPVPNEFELYNLTEDPLEERNLASPKYQTPKIKAIEQMLMSALEEQCKQKRLAPSSGSVPGMPSCSCDGV